MKFLRPLLTALVAVVLAAPALAQTAAAPEARVIVRFKPQADSVRAKALALRATRGEARDVAQTRATALGMRTGHALRAGLSLDERTHVVMASGLSGAQLARQLAADPEVEFVAVDGRRKALALPDDPLFGGATVNSETTSGGIQNRVIDQWYLKAPGSTTNPAVVSSINAPAAWDVTTGSANVVVAILDTGVRSDHPDLAAKLLPPVLAGQSFAGYDMVGFSSKGTTQESNSVSLANDGDGADADASDPGDWITLAENTTPGTQYYHCEPDSSGNYPAINSSWHGTRVAGLIGAGSDNRVGMAGVGWNLKLLPVRVLGKCGGYDSDIIAGMKWAAGIAVPGLPANPNKAKVLNLSLGGSGSCGTTGTGALYRDAITQVNAAGATIVIAAGNSEGQAVGLPGNCPGVVTVTALRHVGTKVGFASVGPEVTIAAPGGNCINTLGSQPCLYPMVSTTNSGTTSPVAYTGDGVYTGSGASVGTSFSAPIVSGIVGLMASVRPNLTSAEATQILKLTARAFPTTGGGSAADGNPQQCKAPTTAVQDECYCTTSTCGAGMVDAAAAVTTAKLLNDATVTVTPSPASGLTAGQTLTLTAAATGLASGRSVTSTAWTIADGGGIVTGFASGAGTATATVVPTGAGSFTVRADITDNTGLTYSQTATISVAAAVVTPPATTGTTSSSGGGGGGAASAAWLAALLLAAFSVRRSTPAPRRCKA
ncbi:S8 family serine peptidase [Roseateles cellulosilyticus]|uniref:S8 family serine peptidase n=1 Tax=Pelomonas cellulosilytica TaxID=2906762 RepID=A0ABS8XZL3_9BURK|nr:S8 family serine peptidase [Pelomonas sp. P8]MCE4557423.1 S8 family serine peptidase [Pelomonas sp. P8]